MFGLESISDIYNWVVQNLIWIILTVVIIFAFRLVRVPRITKKLLKENRYALGKGFGKHYADRCIDIWY